MQINKLSLLLVSTLFLISATLGLDPFYLTQFTFRQQYTSTKYPVTIPSTTATDLIKAGLLSSNPYFRDNFLQYYKYQTKNFIYQSFFQSPQNFTNSQKQIVFQGLDTHASVYLNGKLILQAHNMFRTYRVNVSLSTKDNNLTIIFNSSAVYDQQKQKQFKNKYGFSLPANYSFTRKAAYQYGWDWGPRILSVGIWKPISIQKYEIIVQSLRVKMQQPITQKYPKQLQFSVNAHLAQTPINIDIPYKIMLTLTTSNNISLLLQNGTYSFNESSYKFNKKFKLDNTTSIKNISNLIWWTWDLGQPNLFNLTMKIFEIGKQNQSVVKRVQTGFRSVKVRQNVDKDGKQFTINLNGYDLYMRGGNYIPPEMSMPSVSSKTYKDIATSSLFAKFNMLRLWGGGQFQNSQFYSTMDRSGILVWHDLMFACAMYPATNDGPDGQLQNIKQQMLDNLKRLSHHPSIALWNGNNQVWIGWQQWGWKNGLNSTQIQQAQTMYRKIFNQTLPQTIQQITPDIFYWQTSPSSSSNQPSTISSGDIHFWRVWGGGTPIQQYQVYVGRFNSEYGMQSMPEYSSIIQYTSQFDRYIDSDILRLHQRHIFGDKYLPGYTRNYSGQTKDLSRYSYYTQVMQAYALQMAIVSLRGNKPFNMGSIYWQLNDVWPVSSWATVDYYGIYKAAHYRIRQAYGQMLVHVVHAPKNNTSEELYKAVAVNQYDKPISMMVTIKYMDFNGTLLQSFQVEKTVNPLQNLVLMRLNTNALQKNRTLINVNARTTGLFKDTYENNYYFVVPKDRVVMNPNLTVTLHNATNSITIKCNNFLANYVWIRSKSSELGLNLQDNYFDMLKGAQITVKIPNGVKLGDLEVSSYQNQRLSQVKKEDNEEKEQELLQKGKNHQQNIKINKQNIQVIQQ